MIWIKIKNFEIIGFSIDEKRSNWINALDKEQINWVNVTENKGFNGLIVSKYAVKSIPSNFLINPEGKVVAKDLSIEDLEKRLQENIKE